MKTRVVSAIVAVMMLFTIFLVWRQKGLVAITAVVALGCIYEYSRLMFARLDVPRHLHFSFLLLCAAILLATGFHDSDVLVTAAVVTVFFFTMSVLSVMKPGDLPIVLQFASLAAMGFLYCGVFSGLVIRLAQMPQGPVWLLSLLAIVFSGDTFAYLTGRLFGKTKLLEPVSPKKTVEGSLGGLVGSLIAGVLLGIFFLPDLPLGWLALTAVATGAFAQVGDLFESLLKRVADVKDSGGIMPGHGGLLDRVDGVIFATPIFIILVKFLTNS